MSQAQITKAAIDAAIAERVNNAATRVVNKMGDFMMGSVMYLKLIGKSLIAIGMTSQFMDYFRYLNGFTRGDIKATSHVTYADEDMTLFSKPHYDKVEMDGAISSAIRQIRSNLFFMLGGYSALYLGKIFKEVGGRLKEAEVRIL
ncbi:Hypothetical protein FSTVST1_338 [Faustovirus ST1]|nr:Hypothetical protein FSTVST1_338 [Faustovirus ST1]